MTHLYSIDHSRTTGYLRNYDPIKHYFCLLPYNDTSRPIIVSQEYLIHFDDFLFPSNVPTIIAKPLTVIKHFVSALLNDKEEFYYTELSKRAIKIVFFSAKIIAFMVKAEKEKSEPKHTTLEHYTPKTPTTTTDKLNNVLTSRTLRDLTYELELYKKNPSDSPLATPTHVLDCYDHTIKVLQSLDIDSQRITQSSKAIQTTLENLNIVFLILYNASQVNFTFFLIVHTHTHFKLFHTCKLFNFCNFETF